jgi:uncharacterized protein (TIGR04551 family)
VKRLLTAVAVLALSSPALAQMMPGGGFGAPGMAPGMQPPPPGAGGQQKQEGPAEEAPEETRPSDLEPLGGYAEQERRKMQVFELTGSLRLRTDYMHQFFLGQGYTNVPSNLLGPAGVPAAYGLPPFPVPLDCPTGNPVPGTNSNPGGNCSTKNMGGANLRFRLQPTLNVSDQVRVHSQIDVFDNTVMGSTPDSLAGVEGFNRTPGMTTTTPVVTPPPGVATAPVLSYTQYPPEVGQNGYVSGIRAKRAWAEIDTEFGSIRFGRMPWHWGRGLFYNDGNCIDCDVGTTTDRVMGLTTVYGHQLALAWDLGAQGLTTQQLTLGRSDPSGYPYDLSQNDDVLQLVAAVTRLDGPVRLRERIDAGDVVVQYGFQFVYRNQGKITLPSTSMSSTVPDSTTYDPPRVQNFDAVTFTPDVWFKLHYKALTVEFEGVGVLGRIRNPGPLSADAATLSLRQAGWVIASELRLYRDSFFVGLETGGATGDQAEEPGQYLNYRWRFVQQRQGDHNLNDFHFSPDYHVDQIFFRHIMGTVTNAIYIKPQTSYWFDLGQTRQLGLSGSLIYSMAQVPVSTPGNGLSYGVEMDVGAGYRNTAEGFYAGFTWGVFFPLSALDRSPSLWGIEAMDASVAQILRIYMGVKF